MPTRTPRVLATSLSAIAVPLCMAISSMQLLRPLIGQDPAPVVIAPPTAEDIARHRARWEQALDAHLARLWRTKGEAVSADNRARFDPRSTAVLAVHLALITARFEAMSVDQAGLQIEVEDWGDGAEAKARPFSLVDHQAIDPDAQRRFRELDKLVRKPLPPRTVGDVAYADAVRARVRQVLGGFEDLSTRRVARQAPFPMEGPQPNARVDALDATFAGALELKVAQAIEALGPDEGADDGPGDGEPDAGADRYAEDDLRLAGEILDEALRSYLRANGRPTAVAREALAASREALDLVPGLAEDDVCGTASRAAVEVLGEYLRGLEAAHAATKAHFESLPATVTILRVEPTMQGRIEVSKGDHHVPLGRFNGQVAPAERAAQAQLEWQRRLPLYLADLEAAIPREVPHEIPHPVGAVLRADLDGLELRLERVRASIAELHDATGAAEQALANLRRRAVAQRRVRDAELEVLAAALR